MQPPQYDGDDPQQIQLVNMIPKFRSEFKVAIETDTTIIDHDIGSSVTNDARAVFAWLNANLDGGIGPCRVYYWDTSNRFDELCVAKGAFSGFKACSAFQQVRLHSLILLSRGHSQ
jgi:hypothetical protein